MRRASNSPSFIIASNPKQLERMMLLNNIKHNVSFDYKIIYANNKWYAWFDMDRTLNKLKVVKHGIEWKFKG